MLENKKGEKETEQVNQINLSSNVLVIEKELRNESIHKSLITGIQNLTSPDSVDGGEFLTCGIEMAFKVWDKTTQTCDYTIETHEPVHSMAITGEKGDMMIASLGDGNLIVYGLTNKNELDIVENAHASTVIQIVSLSKLKNKYFATRCLAGHVNIWSATNHPDRLFTIENVDRDESQDQTSLMGNSANLGQGIDIDFSQNQTFSGLMPSDKDKMIELKWKFAVQTSSTTVLCFSNFNAQQVIIATVDLKTRRKNIIKTFKNNHRPTFLYQIDEDYILVGTEGGFIEYWSKDEILGDCIEAHPESQDGISSIIELKTQSELLWGPDIPESMRVPSTIDPITQQYVRTPDQYRLLATSALGSSSFRIWTLIPSSQTLTPHIRIDTSLTLGIKYLLETSPTQIVAVDSDKTLKFYDFVDKALKEAEEEEAKHKEHLAQMTKEFFNKYDRDHSGRIDKKECWAFIQDLIQYFRDAGWTVGDVSEEDFQIMFDGYDLDKSGALSRFELKQVIDSMGCFGEGMYDAMKAEQKKKGLTELKEK